MRRRIIVHNEFARTLDVREGIKKVPVHALQKGDVLSGSGEKVVRTTHDAAPNRVGVLIEKAGYQRLVHWAGTTLVGVVARDSVNDEETWEFRLEDRSGNQFFKEITAANQREAIKKSREFGRFVSVIGRVYRSSSSEQSDGVGTPEEVAYGEGWHSHRVDNPYNEPELKAAWEKGRTAKRQKSKMTGNYFKGETRGKRFEPPKARVNNDFKSEKGYVAKLIDVKTGSVLARSEPHISNGVGLKNWIREEATRLIRAGKRVKAEVAVVFFDPNLVHDVRSTLRPMLWTVYAKLGNFFIGDYTVQASNKEGAITEAKQKLFRERPEYKAEHKLEFIVQRAN